MAGPVNGIGGQQQVPLSQTHQPGGSQNESAQRARESDPKENTSRSRDAAASQSQGSKKEDDLLRKLLAEALEGNDEPQQNSSARRGSVVDLTV